MNNIYYHVGDADEIQAILRNGFIDNVQELDDTGKVLKRGVYIIDAPGEPDPNYPLDQLLEIAIPPEIDLRKWRLVEFPFGFVVVLGSTDCWRFENIGVSSMRRILVRFALFARRTLPDSCREG